FRRLGVGELRGEYERNGHREPHRHFAVHYSPGHEDVSLGTEWAQWSAAFFRRQERTGWEAIGPRPEPAVHDGIRAGSPPPIRPLRSMKRRYRCKGAIVGQNRDVRASNCPISMAQKSTICKAALFVSDIDRGYYREH